MTNQHTPGPWESVQNDPVMVRPGIEAPALNFSVVLFGADDDDGGVRGRTPEEEQANARLIAAAPDLLALAKQYAKECAQCCGDGDVAELDAYGNVTKPVPCPDCADIRAVIKKALGLE